MGGKRSGARKHVYLYLAGLIWLSACTGLVAVTERPEAQGYLQRAESLLARGDYEGSLRENEKVLSLAGNAAPAEEALFNMGLIYIHPGNPKKDYRRAAELFQRIVAEYPDTPWTERAKALADIVDRIAAVNPAQVQENQEARELNRAAESLLSQGNYEGSLRESQEALAIAGEQPPADETLFNIALVYAHPDNPKRNNIKAIAALKQLIREHPKSPWTDRAKVWASLLESFEKSKKVDMEIEEKKRDKRR